MGRKLNEAGAMGQEVKASLKADKRADYQVCSNKWRSSLAVVDERFESHSYCLSNALSKPTRVEKKAIYNIIAVSVDITRGRRGLIC